MTYKENIKAILECYFTGFKEAIIESACNRILDQEPCEDAISREAVLDINENHHGQMPNHINHQIWQEIKDLPPVIPQPKTRHCEDCKYFRKLPYHIDILGKCICHTGFCPGGDWYCADYEPQESEG